VPEILLSGNHANIAAWRHEQSLRRTLEHRPDLLENANLSKSDRKLLEKIIAETSPHDF
jgi:tRNA (guanine37-N1)-methyltransferase